MKLIQITMAVAMAFSSAVWAQKSDSAEKKGADAKKPAASNTSALPANAKKIGEGIWRATDAEGKVWIYYETMMGYSRRPEAEYLSTITGQKATPVKGSAEVPKGAVQVDEGHWEYKDASGKVWVYNQTPFGMSKVEKVTGGREHKPEPGELYVKSVKDGEVEFEKETPFGRSRWTKKVSNLNEEEKTALEVYAASNVRSNRK